MNPLLIVSMGRTGSTFLMRLLSCHPEVVAHQHYPLEFRLLAHLVYPEDEISAESVRSMHYRFSRDYELLYGSIERGEDLSIAQVRKVYSQIASENCKIPRLFAEKFRRTLSPLKIQALCPGVRFVVLMRDPRDVLLSARAFDRKRGYRGFRERDGDSDETVVLRYAEALNGIAEFVLISGAELVRYEDIVTAPIETLTRLFGRIDVSDSATIIAKCMEQAAAMEGGQHMTSRSLQASVGRWRLEMDATLQDYFLGHLGHILERFGYSTV